MIFRRHSALLQMACSIMRRESRMEWLRYYQSPGRRWLAFVVGVLVAAPHVSDEGVFLNQIDGGESLATPLHHLPVGRSSPMMSFSRVAFSTVVFPSKPRCWRSSLQLEGEGRKFHLYSFACPRWRLSLFSIEFEAGDGKADVLAS